MKSFRKALAVLLSVLMVVFSFPLSALAIPNPNQTPDNKYSTDYDVELRAYVMNYDGRNAFGYDSSDPTILTDVKHLKKSDLTSEDGMFCIYIAVVGLDAADSYNLTFEYDTAQVVNAYYKSNSSILTGEEATSGAVLGTYAGDFQPGTGAMDGGTSSRLNGRDELYIGGITSRQGEIAAETTDLSYGDGEVVVDGQVMACFGMQLQQDEVDLTQAIRCQANDASQQIATVFGNDNKNITIVGATIAGGPNDGQPSLLTKYTWPEWGYVDPTEPSEVTYTYTKADGSSEQVTAAAGEAPVAPANTADTAWASDGEGNHTKTTYSWPEWSEGTTEYKEVATPVKEACTMVEKEAAVDPTHTTPGKTAVMECSVCGYTTGGEEIPADANAHSYSEVERVASTCKTQGYVKYQCECGDSYTEKLALDPSNHEDVVTDAAVAATCTTTGLTEGSHCAACGETIVKQEVIEALGHDYQIKESTEATCCTEGTVTYECSRCHDIKVETGVLNPNNHEGGTTEGVNAKEATRGEDGYTGDTVCNGCGATLVKGEVIPALGVQVTVTSNELGTTTLNGEATTGAAQKVAYAKDYTLAATANEGAEFVGWSVAGKIVSTNATYTTTAYADTTYVPVFAEAESNAFTVTFVDQFNKVVDTIDSTELASLEALPTAPTYMGYTFDSWNLSLEEVKALTEATVVTANYTKNELSFTINAPNCTITVGGQAYENTASVGFDAKVTVTPKSDTATSWTVNGGVASYGDAYTFYVTSDVNVAYDTDSVTAKPTVTAVSAEQLASDDRYVRFLATRTVPEGYSLVESGFVYGKGMAEEDLVLENVGTVQGTANGTVKLVKNSNTAGDGQFALTFGVASKDAVASARAYIIAKDAEGVATVYYADAQIFDYNA